MALSQIKSALQYSEGRSKPWSGAKLLNCFAEKGDGDKVVDFAVMAIPGLELFASVGSGPVRGEHRMGALLYVVSGAQLYSVNSAGQSVLLGSISGSGPVRMADNGEELAICATPYGYVLSGGAITTPADLPSVSDVAFIDGYFVWTIYQSDQAIYSGLYDGTSYDLLDVFTAEGSPDGLIGIINDHRELHMCGAESDEIFYNSGGADNAFERQGNAFIERGFLARDTIQKIDNTVFFLGNDKIVYRLDGYSPIRISTHAIEYRLRNADETAEAFVYTQEGHKFYVLTADDGTFAYDVATGAWHERRSQDLANYRIGAAETIWSRTILGDRYNGNLYIPSLDLDDENGDRINVQIVLPTLEAARQRVTMYAFEVYCETGTGTPTTPDPQIMLRYSDNGGRTWSNQLWRSLGAVGDYRHRAIWRGLGQFRQRDIELTITDNARKFVMAYYADVR
jgi:hypothetical protein